MVVAETGIHGNKDGVRIEATVVVMDVDRMHLVLRRWGYFGGCACLESRIPTQGGGGMARGCGLAQQRQEDVVPIEGVVWHTSM